MFAGIDTHKDSLAVAVIDHAGRELAGGQLPNTEPGFLELVELLEVHQFSGWGSRDRATSVARSRCIWR